MLGDNRLPQPSSMSGKTSSHWFSGNTTCILYYKAFQGIWLKTTQQWGMLSFCCWNKLRLLTKWVLMSMMWLDSSLNSSWKSIHTDTDCELGSSLRRQQVLAIVIPLVPASFLSILICSHQSDFISLSIWIQTQTQCAVWADSQIMFPLYNLYFCI